MTEEIIATNKQLDIIDKEGNMKHYNMNDHGWISHAEGYYDYANELLTKMDIPELKRLVQSNDVMDYYKIEYFLVSKLGYISHKSWIDGEEEYHHFCKPLTGITMAQMEKYEELKQLYYCEEEIYYEESEENFYGWIFIKTVQKTNDR